MQNLNLENLGSGHYLWQRALHFCPPPRKPCTEILLPFHPLSWCMNGVYTFQGRGSEDPASHTCTFLDLVLIFVNNCFFGNPPDQIFIWQVASLQRQVAFFSVTLRTIFISVLHNAPPYDYWSTPYCPILFAGKTWKMAGFCAHFLFRESTDHDLIDKHMIISMCHLGTTVISW